MSGMAEWSSTEWSTTAWSTAEWSTAEWSTAEWSFAEVGDRAPLDPTIGDSSEGEGVIRLRSPFLIPTASSLSSSSTGGGGGGGAPLTNQKSDNKNML
jgi:hypothetical protein